jgi:MoaA/NifB/PqqE/SkfB family radical SAM enzyme
VSVTDRCNLRCKTCNIWKKPKIDLPLDYLKAIFKKFKNLNWISFTGGEPFLRDDLVYIAYLALKECPSLHTISIPTNGFFTDKILKDVKDILKLGIPSLYVSVSLDGLEEVHDSIRGVKGSFKRAVNTFRLLKKIKDKRFKVHFEYTISRFNQGMLPQTVETLGTPEDFIISVAQNAFYYVNEKKKIKPVKKLLYSDIKWFLSTHKGCSVHDFATKMFLKSILEKRRIPCVAGKNSFYINTKGEIYPCIFIRKKLGTINDSNIKKFIYPGCQCYTPCESYISLLISAKNALKLIK